MKSFVCYNQILFRNILRDCICDLCRACNFDHDKRIFNSNERRILINQYFVFSFLFLVSNLIDSCLLIFAMHYIFYFLLLYQLNFCFLLFKEFR